MSDVMIPLVLTPNFTVRCLTCDYRTDSSALDLQSALDATAVIHQHFADGKTVPPTLFADVADYSAHPAFLAIVGSSDAVRAYVTAKHADPTRSVDVTGVSVDPMPVDPMPVDITP